MAVYRTLKLQQFRSYRQYEAVFEPGVNIIVGPNGSGKTNLLEALYVLSAGTSFRVTDRDLLMHNQNWFRLDGDCDGRSRVLTYQIKADSSAEKQFIFDETRRARLTHNHKIPVVLFEPDHLRLLKASPSHRRDYVDNILTRLQPDFTWQKHQFERTLLQRNNVLKRRLPATARADQLFAWNVGFVELASNIVARRQELITRLSARLSDVYSRIAGKTHLATITYQNTAPGASYAATLMALLEAHAEHDAERGYTSVGPHRDDFIVSLDGAPAASSASRGEVRSLLLALKIIELELLDEQQPTTPLLLLDDVFSELDALRRRALAELSKTYQTLITTTDADAITSHFTSGYRIIDTTLN